MENGSTNSFGRSLVKAKPQPQPQSQPQPSTLVPGARSLNTRSTAITDFVHKVKESVNIIEVIGENVVLRKSGGNYVGLCPFHSERTPSFSVSESKQLFHCYGCRQGGDLLTFVMEISALSFFEAIEELADRAQLPLPAEMAGKGDPAHREDQQQKREKSDLAYKLNRFTAAYFHQTLLKDPTSSRYLASRGVNDETRQAFYLGAATSAWDGLSSHLTSKKAPLDLAQELGLIRSSQKGHFDLFRNRTLFPILNIRGKIAGFGGRVLLDTDTPKYLNSPDSLIFHKGKLAYGLYQAQKYIREQDEVILVEGYFDVLTLYAAGFRNVVATCGTALTADHLHAFRRLASRVVVVFDGDSAGISATLRAMEVGLDQGWVLQGVQMPPDLDPDEILLDLSTGEWRPDGKEKMTALLKGARPILDTQIAEAIHVGRRDPEAQSQAVKIISKWLARLNDPTGRNLRLEIVQKQLGVSRAVLLGAMGELSVSVGQSTSQVATLVNAAPVHSSVEVSKLSNSDQILLYGIVAGGEYLNLFLAAKGQIPPSMDLSELLENGPARSWVFSCLAEPNRLKELKAQVGRSDSEGLDEQVRSVITAGLVSDTALVKLEEFRLAVLKSVAKKWARFSQLIKRQLEMAEAQNDAGIQAKLWKEFLDVQHKMKDFNSFYDKD